MRQPPVRPLRSFMFSVAGIAGETALQLSGFHSLPLAALCGGTAVVSFAVGMWGVVYDLRSKVRPAKPVGVEEPPLTTTPRIYEKTFIWKPQRFKVHAPRTGNVVALEVEVRRRPVRVVPTIKFTDRESKVLILKGRWGDTALPDHPDRAVQSLEFKAGESHALDLLLQASEGVWYALDNKSPFDRYQIPEYALRPPVVVEVSLSGSIEWEALLTVREWTDGQPRVTQLVSRRRQAVAGSEERTVA
jgi:hypothetical protein